MLYILPWGEFNMQMRSTGLLAAALLLSNVLATSSPAFSQTKKEASSMPKVGDMAPDFTLKYFDGNDLKDVKLRKTSYWRFTFSLLPVVEPSK